MNQPQPIELALAFLSASPSEQIRFLSALPVWASYQNDDGETVECRNTEACLHACAAALGGFVPQAAPGDRPLLTEAFCVISMMTALASSVIDYHMELEKGPLSATGPFDDAWSVLRRLAAATQARKLTSLAGLDANDLLRFGPLRPSPRSSDHAV